LKATAAVQRELTRRARAGLALLKQGALNQALETFEAAAALLSRKTEAGGLALLQKAITLDSLGRHQEALSLYRQLIGHRSSYISKTARAGACAEAATGAS